jgi:hypothetical protein
MNIALGIGTLLLGGWALNTPIHDLPPDQAPPEVQIPFPQDAAPAGPYAGPMRRNQDPARALPRDQVQGRLRAQNEPAARNDMDENARRAALAKGQSTRQINPQSSAQKLAPWVLPAAPTDPIRANTPGSMQYPLPPTVREQDLAPGEGAVDPYASPTAPKLVDISPSRQAYSPRTAQSPSVYDNASDVRDRVEMATHPAYANQPAPPKAFADVRPFSGGVSPYMNLFRNDTAGGTIDNYSTFVRPALDQRSTNQQFNLDLWGLQRAQRIQNSALQQLGRNYQRGPQPVGTPDFYRNYGNYYPGTNSQGGNYGQRSYGGGY